MSMTNWLSRLKTLQPNVHFAICKCDLRLVFFQTTEFNQRKKINFEEKNRGKFVPQKGNVNLIVTRAFNTISHADQTKRYQTRAPFCRTCQNSVRTSSA